MKFKRFKQLHESVRKLDLLNIKSDEIDHDLLADIIKENPGFHLKFGKEVVRDLLKIAREEAELITVRSFMRCKVFIFDLDKALYFKFSTKSASICLKATNTTGNVATVVEVESKELESALSKPHIDLNRIMGSKFDTLT